MDYIRRTWLAALLLLAAPAPSAGDEGAGERVRARVIARCGIAPDRLAVAPMAEPLLTTLVLKGAGALSDDQLDCYATTLAGGRIYPVIEDQALSRRYGELADRDTMRTARNFLREMGLLERLPARARDEPLAAYARRLEALCAAPPGSVLRADGDWLGLALGGEASPPSKDPRAWLCAVHAAVVAGHNPLRPWPVNVSVY